MVVRPIEIRVGMMCFLHGGNERRNDKKRNGQVGKRLPENVLCFSGSLSYIVD